MTRQHQLKDVRILLDNIRSVHNVGSIFRTAETLGISVIYCGGTTPQPIDRFGRKKEGIAKVSLGAEDLIAWEYVEDAKNLVRKLKKNRFTIIAIEQDSKSIDYKKVRANNKTLVILGNEVGGISESLLRLADKIVEIPLRGRKESLNVSVAAGIVLFKLFD